MVRGLSANGDDTKALELTNKALPLAPNEVNKQAILTMIEKLKTGKRRELILHNSSRLYSSTCPPSCRVQKVGFLLVLFFCDERNCGIAICQARDGRLLPENSSCPVQALARQQIEYRNLPSILSCSFHPSANQEGRRAVYRRSAFLICRGMLYFRNPVLCYELGQVEPTGFEPNYLPLSKSTT